jgi:catechol 2,3-dioxygenase-like lactoylglutathione lyase family enzyme
MIAIQSIDHLVLTVKNIEASCTFYKTILGIENLEFKPGRYALIVGKQKINLHETGDEFTPHAKHPTCGSADLCFLISGDIQHLVNHLLTHKIEIETGPVERTGAQGPIMSVYIRDPDGNLLEISTLI